MSAPRLRKLAIAFGLCAAGASLVGAPAAFAGPGADATVVTSNTLVDPGSEFHGTPDCGSQRVIGGGVAVGNPAAGYVIGSAPLSDHSWLGMAFNSTTAQQVGHGYAICSPSADATLEYGQFTLGPAQDLVGTYGEKAVACSSGERAIGGGVISATGGSIYERVHASGPLDETGTVDGTATDDVARYWFAAVSNHDATAGRKINVYAFCSPTSRATIVSAPLAFTGENGMYVPCPDGSRALGGGAVSSANDQQFLEYTYPPDDGGVPTGWLTRVKDLSGGTTTDNFTAICEPASSASPPGSTPAAGAAPTGQRAAALAKCKKKKSKKARKKCRRKARRLPA